MKKLLLLASVFFIMILNSCSTTSIGLPSSSNYTITHTHKDGKYEFSDSVGIAYQDYAFIVKNEKEKLATRMASAEEINSVLSKIPKGGRATIKVESITMGSANTENFEFILRENGKEILRERGSDQVAQVPMGGSRMWWNLEMIFFPKPITNTMTLHVVNLLTGARDDFAISKK